MLTIKVACAIKNYNSFIGAHGAYAFASDLAIGKLEQAVAIRKSLEHELKDLEEKNPKVADLIREVSSC